MVSSGAFQGAVRATMPSVQAGVRGGSVLWRWLSSNSDRARVMNAYGAMDEMVGASEYGYYSWRGALAALSLGVQLIQLACTLLGKEVCSAAAHCAPLFSFPHGTGVDVICCGAVFRLYRNNEEPGLKR